MATRLCPGHDLHDPDSHTFFTVISKMGEGAFSLVYQAEVHPGGGEGSINPNSPLVLMAYYPYISDDVYNHMTSTLALLNEEKCKHVIKMICHFRDPSTGLRCLVVEKWKRTLSAHLHHFEPPAPPSLKDITIWSYQLALGLDAIHRRGIVHGGICTHNLLVGEADNNGDISLCISGFGTSMRRRGAEVSHQPAFVPLEHYMVPPEIRRIIRDLYVSVLYKKDASSSDHSLYVCDSEMKLSCLSCLPSLPSFLPAWRVLDSMMIY